MIQWRVPWQKGPWQTEMPSSPRIRRIPGVSDVVHIYRSMYLVPSLYLSFAGAKPNKLLTRQAM